MWAKKSGKKLKFFSDKVDWKTKQKILKYGVVHNSWAKAARKFATTLRSVSSWAKKAGMKLRFLKTKPNRCEVCKILLDKNMTLDEHIAVAHITSAGNCNVCGKTSADLNGIDDEDLVFYFYGHIIDM